MLHVLDSPLYKATEFEKMRLKSFLQTTKEEILVAQPDLRGAPATLPWKKATRVFDATQFREVSDLVGCVFVDKILYGFCLQFEEDRSALRLIRVSLSGGFVELLGKADLGMPARSLPAHLRPQFVPASCADGEAIYAATNGAGIVVFPLKGGSPRRIELVDGLPSNSVVSLAVMDGRLYAGFVDGYLISYDLAARRCDVIASSRRKQKLSPFDDGDVFRVPTLIADPERHRVVFVIGKHVWQITSSDGKIAQVLDLVAVSRGRSEPKLTGSTIFWSSPLRGDRLLVSNVFHVIEIDLSRNSASEIHSPETGIFPTQTPHLVANGSLWCGGSFGRLSLDKREYQSLPPPETGIAHFRPSVCLELTSDGRQIVAADAYSIWLLDLVEIEPSVEKPGSARER